VASTDACRVLLVDDTPEIRQVLRALLGVTGELEVVGEARDGREAISLAEQHQPDVVVLDIAMPVMTGLDAIPEIARVSPETSIVMFSAHASPDTREEALRRGAHHFVRKGGDPTEVVEAVHEGCAEG